MKKLAIIGSGDLGQQICYHAREDNHFIPVGFFDDFEKVGIEKHGYPVLGNVKDIKNFYKKNYFDALMIGIGYKHFSVRSSLFKSLSPTIPFATIIHSSSYVSKSCKIGHGVFVYPGCTLDMNVLIGNNVLINAGCTIAHDTSIGDHSFLSPAVAIAGFVKVEQSVSLGIGTIVIDNISISEGVKTGAGAVVAKDISTPGLYLGIPAKLNKAYDSF